MSVLPSSTRPLSGPLAGRGWRRTLVAVLLLVAAGAVYGGVGLMSNGMGMPRAWLARTPFDSWTWPGVALLGTVALPQVAVAGLVLAGRRWASLAGVAAGAGLVLWIVVQLVALQRYSFLQPVIAGFGVLEMVLAWGWHRAGGAARAGRHRPGGRRAP
jgi:hypothetical protein